VVCSVVVVVVGFAGCMVVSSVVVVLLVVRGSSEAQPASAPRTEASRQKSKSFFIILISPQREMRLLMQASASNGSKLVFVLVVTHVLAIDGHRRGRSFGCGRMPLVLGATDKRDKRKRSKAGENQIFDHISFIKVGATGAHGKSMRAS
jgi:hypothetical protein